MSQRSHSYRVNCIVPSMDILIGVVTSDASTKLNCSSSLTVSPCRQRDNSASNFSTFPFNLAAFSFSLS